MCEDTVLALALLACCCSEAVFRRQTVLGNGLRQCGILLVGCHFWSNGIDRFTDSSDDRTCAHPSKTRTNLVLQLKCCDLWRQLLGTGSRFFKQWISMGTTGAACSMTKYAQHIVEGMRVLVFYHVGCVGASYLQASCCWTVPIAHAMF